MRASLPRNFSQAAEEADAFEEKLTRAVDLQLPDDLMESILQISRNSCRSRHHRNHTLVAVNGAGRRNPCCDWCSRHHLEYEPGLGQCR